MNAITTLSSQCRAIQPYHRQGHQGLQAAPTALPRSRRRYTCMYLPSVHLVYEIPSALSYLPQQSVWSLVAALKFSISLVPSLWSRSKNISVPQARDHRLVNPLLFPFRLVGPRNWSGALYAGPRLNQQRMRRWPLSNMSRKARMRTYTADWCVGFMRSGVK